MNDPATTGVPASHAASRARAPARGTLLAMAVTCGVAVATLYLNQPLLGLVEGAFPNSAVTPLIPTLTQLGYAVGLLLLVPLGDAFDRRRLILIQLAGLFLALLAASAARSALVLAAASLAIGVTATAAQQVVPLTASLAPDARRGAAVGTVMSGLLCGILFSRTLAGFVGVHFGWRAAFLVCAPAVLGVAGWCAVVLPRRPSDSGLSYRALLASLGRLWREEPLLRRATFNQSALFASFSAFWTVLALHLAAPPYRLGADVAGAFGLLGVAGVFGATVVGRVADRRGPGGLIAAAAATVLASWFLFAAGLGLGGLAVGVVGLDLGVQSSLVANQHVIYALRSEARSRVNTLFMTGIFLGGAAGSAIAVQAWRLEGWRGVCVVGGGAALVACGVQGLHVLKRSRSRTHEAPHTA